VAIAMHIVNTSRDDPLKANAEVWRLMDERGISRHPKGQQFHAAWLVGADLHVFNVWDSAEDNEAFMRDLRPILEEVGMGITGPPEVGELVQFVQPTVAAASGT
jgi:hypothetical protein